MKTNSRKDKIVCFRLPLDDFEFYKALCEQRNITMTELIVTTMLEKYQPGYDPDMYWHGHA